LFASGSKGHWVPFSPPPLSSFPMKSSRLLPDTVPCLLALTGSSSRTLYASARVPSASSLPHASRCGAPSLGFRALFATSASGIVAMGVPLPNAFRPRRFSRPRRFQPPPASRVCFTPQPRPGFTLQGFCLASSRTISSMAVALSSLTNPRCRLPGATLAGPALRALLCRRVRCFFVGV
jgi:hypothetical protein